MILTVADQIFRRNQVAREKRISEKRKERSETWLFICEGTKTEPNYLTSLIGYANNITSEAPLKFQIEGVGRNTETLVECVDDYFDYIEKCNAQKKGIPYAKTFVLFDKDSFKSNQFNNAIKMAETRGYIPIWSNECFELWYILHYEYYSSDNGREAYFTKLTDLLGEKYSKSDDVFSIIHSPENLKQALSNSKKLDKEFSNENSASKKVPCTQMFRLIEEIQNRLKVDLTKV